MYIAPFPLAERLLSLLLIALVCISLCLSTSIPEIALIRFEIAIACGGLIAASCFGRSRFLWLRPYILAVVVFMLYTPAGRLGLLNSDGKTFDEALNWADRTLVGFDISASVPQFSRFAVEALAFIYAFFIPFIHVSLFLNFVGRRGVARESFLVGFILLYAVSFLGYLFIPSLGPGSFPVLHNHLPIDGGFFYSLIRSSIASTGGDFGAFPSLHVGATVYFCLSDFSRDRLRALLVIPLAIGIAVATIVLRLHYVTDLIAGLALALLSWKCGSIYGSRRAHQGIETK